MSILSEYNMEVKGKKSSVGLNILGELSSETESMFEHSTSLVKSQKS